MQQKPTLNIYTKIKEKLSEENWIDNTEGSNSY